MAPRGGNTAKTKPMKWADGERGDEPVQVLGEKRKSERGPIDMADGSAGSTFVEPCTCTRSRKS